MSTPTEIENAIEKLPTGQLLEVAAWLDDYRTMIQSSENLFEQLDVDEEELAGQQWSSVRRETKIGQIGWISRV